MSNWQPPDGYGHEILALLAFVIALMWGASTFYAAIVGGLA